MDLEAHVLWGTYEIILAYILMKLMWISYEIDMNFIPVLYELHMDLTKNVYRKTHANLMQTSYDLHMNFIKLYDSFICTSYAAHMKYNWNLYEIADNYFVWTADELHMHSEVIVN